jgi:hypothetical protein
MPIAITRGIRSPHKPLSVIAGYRAKRPAAGSGLPAISLITERKNVDADPGLRSRQALRWRDGAASPKSRGNACCQY